MRSFERKCLSPFEWRFGWLRAVAPWVLLVAAILGLKARSQGADVSLLVVAAAFALLSAAFVWPSKVTLGEDGIALRRYGFTTFVPYTKIERTEAIQRTGAGTSKRAEPETRWTILCGVRLYLSSGGTLEIGTGKEVVTTERSNFSVGAYGAFGAANRSGRELKREIDDRTAAYRATTEPTETLAGALMRGKKTPAEWLAAIGALAPVDAGAYRGGDAAKEALWRVLEDDTAPREARAGAAVALRTALDDESRHRMRVVVDSCESPKLRVALETALEEEASEPRLIDALEQASLPLDDDA